MNIILGKDFVIGIFADKDNAQAYLARQPADFPDFQHLLDEDLQYPFYIRETPFYMPLAEVEAGGFNVFQTENEAHATAKSDEIIYTITEDYVPDPAWTDQMGSLPHIHVEKT